MRPWFGMLCSVVPIVAAATWGHVRNGGFEVIVTPEQFPPWETDGAVIYPDAELPNPMFCGIEAPDGSARFAGKVANYDTIDFWLGQIVDVDAPGGTRLTVRLNAYYYLASHQNETGHDEFNVRLTWEMGYRSDGADPQDMNDADTWMYLLPPPHWVDGSKSQDGAILCEAHWEPLADEPITWQVPVTICPRKVILRVRGQALWANMWSFVLLDRVQFQAFGQGGDFDEDEDVDLEDFSSLSGCYTGPGVPLPPELPDCTGCDLDGDNDVDLIDLATFQFLYTGP